MSDGLGPVCGAAASHDSRGTLRAMARACARIGRCVDASRRRGALVAWKALFGGCWSVVDHWDEDGLTTLVAHRNEPTAPQAKGLTAREGMIVSLAAQGCSNKEIQYELDCPLSTIASCLTSAILKLGVSSRTALVRLLAPGEGAAIRRRGEEVVCSASAAAGAGLVGLEPRMPEAPANLDAATFRVRERGLSRADLLLDRGWPGRPHGVGAAGGVRAFTRQILSRHRPDSRHLAIHDRQPGAEPLPEAEGPLAHGAGDRRFVRRDGEPRPGLKRERSLLAPWAARIANDSVG